MLAQAQAEGTVSSVSYVADEYLGPSGALRPDVGLLPYVCILPAHRNIVGP